MHDINKDMEALTQDIIDYTTERIHTHPTKLNAPISEEKLDALVGRNYYTRWHWWS